MQHFSNINENSAGGTLAAINTDYIVLVERIVKTMFPFRYDTWTCLSNINISMDHL
jgi:hypothetical protein